MTKIIQLTIGIVDHDETIVDVVEEQHHDSRMHTCSMCKNTKPFDCFYRDARYSSGLMSRCKECAAKATTLYSRTLDGRIAGLIMRKRGYCRRKELPFDLDVHSQRIKKRYARMRCELSGIPLEWAEGAFGAKTPNSPSMDRIVPNRGYVYSNIRIIAWCLNAAFGPDGEDAVFPILRAYVERRLNHGECDS